MINIILLLIASTGLAYISKYNLEIVNVNLGIYTIADIPLFYVIVSSVLAGLTLSYFMQLFTSIYTYFELQGKNKEIITGKREILNLTKTVHQLEIKNEQLKHTDSLPEDVNAL